MRASARTFKPRRLALGIASLSILITTLIISATSAAVRSCGDLPATSTHNTIADVTARNVSCRTARKVTLRAFHKCTHSGCHIQGGWTCNVSAEGAESSMVRCTRGRQAVRFHSGV